MPELVPGTHEVDVEHIVLPGADGAAIDAIHARPDGMPLAGLVLHPDIGGIRPLFDDLCQRLATHGFAVCAPEPFARAPVEVRADADVTARMAYVAQLDDDLQIGDLEIAADYLVVHDDVREVAVLGFCMGGMQALKAAASGRFDRAVAFYGMIRVPDDWVGPKTRQPLDTAADVCPTLAIFGGVDP
jgi:carboxymethylenebutenolidase